MSVDKPKQFVQKWSLLSPTWPSGRSMNTFNLFLVSNPSVLCVDHFATLIATFEESGDSTKLTLTLDGVPVGTEDDIRRNIEGY